MSFSCGIVGLPNAGKSTIFNCLTSSGNAEVSDYPFCTINPNIGVVRIPDTRLDKLRVLLKPDELLPETLKFIDIAGLVKGASHGEGLGNRFLAEIRQVDAILHVVRCFGKGELSPVEDIKVVNTELALSDLDMTERRLEKVEQMIKKGRTGSEEAGRESHVEEKELFLRARDALQKGIPLRRRLIPALSMRGQAPAAAELEVSRSGMLNFLTAKSVIITANVEDTGKSFKELEDFAKAEESPLLYISALLESELQKLTGEEAEEFRREFGLAATALEKLIITSFQALQLITFYTVVGGKVNAWTVKQGTLAPTAAGKVHSDMEQGFIKAEVVSFPDFERCGGIKQAKEKGLLRVEGKGYIVQDGDIIYFHFR
jgi:GTP-binding protein YchF